MVNLKPRDWKSFKYWLHVGMITVITLGLLQLFFGGSMFVLKNILLSIPLIGFADIFTHTILQME